MAKVTITIQDKGTTDEDVKVSMVFDPPLQEGPGSEATAAQRVALMTAAMMAELGEVTNPQLNSGLDN